MKGKLQKIGLGLSGLMCAGMLFTCVLPAKAAPCQHMTYQYLDWGEEYVDEDAFDAYGHYVKRDETGCCGICGEIFVLNSRILRKEDHYFYRVTDLQNGISADFCRDCNYHCP